MAYSDYLHCVRCDAKVLYDAECDYEYLGNGRVIGICEGCVNDVGDSAVEAIITQLGSNRDAVMGGDPRG